MHADYGELSIIVTHLELIFWRIIPIFARSKSLWGIAISQRLQFISTYQRNIFPQLKVLLMAVVRMTELQDIFRHVKLKPLSPDQAKAFHMIRLCRTSALGSHAQVCQECGSTDVSFNSCRNRHCPKCQQSVQEKWVVFCKKPFKSPGHVVRYLGRYTHRVAISNSRILAFDGESVSFAWRDYKDDNKSKVMTLDASEFTRRFLMHVLPNRFVKIRHYGILCSRNIRSKLSKCMKLTGNKPMHLNIKQKEVKVCRSCGSADVITILVPYSFATASSA